MGQRSRITQLFWQNEANVIAQPGQFRAARALLGWPASEVAEKVGSTRQTIQRMEQMPGIPAARAKTVYALRAVFEAAGIEFIGSPEEGPSVRLWRSEQDEERP